MPTPRPSTKNMRRPEAGDAGLPPGFVRPEEFAARIGVAPGPVLLGLSGGADSVSLLEMLRMCGTDVTCVHVNHLIRGEEADRDERFCRELGERTGVRVICVKADVPASAAAGGEGLEEAARRIRYGVFDRIMSEEGIAFLATAHNADDNAETALFNIIRGSGARGACGIPEYRRCANGYVIRPLLRVPKDEILSFCAARGLEYVTDSTNYDVAYSRNRIRSKVIPELKTINASAIGAFSRFTSSLTRDCDYLDSLAEEYIASHDPADSRSLAGAGAAVASRAIAILARRAGARPEKRHVDAILAAAAADADISLTLPGSVIASLRKGKLVFRFDERKKHNIGESSDV